MLICNIFKMSWKLANWLSFLFLEWAWGYGRFFTSEVLNISFFSYFYFFLFFLFLSFYFFFFISSSSTTLLIYFFVILISFIITLFLILIICLSGTQSTSFPLLVIISLQCSKELTWVFIENDPPCWFAICFSN